MHPLGALAPTPPMGWSSWNTFGCDVSAELVAETAEAVVASGMREAGYTYVNIDDCWMARERDAEGRLVPDPETFPDGIAALADHVHALGLKLGIYSSAGSVTCAGYPASLGLEEIDARCFADWGVDLLKYDNCGEARGLSPQERYTTMSRALADAGRPVLLALCDWGDGKDWTWNADQPAGHTWRSTADIEASWHSVMSTLDNHAWVTEFGAPDSWADPDMLEVGVAPLTYAESRAHLALWAVVNAPLICGNDLRSMSEEIRDLLTNPRVVAVDQDWSGQPGGRVERSGDGEVWVKPMSDGSRAVVLLNRGEEAATVATAGTTLGLGETVLELEDVWTGERSAGGGAVEARVAPHDAAFYVVRRAVSPGS